MLDSCYGGVGAVFYDFSKAFDLVDHNILLQKLPYYGLQDSAIKLIESYLRNRLQYVSINNDKSDVGIVEFGVPQGSVLGPLMFTIFLNDISNLKLHGRLVMYADDISLFYPYNHEVILKSQMEQDAEILLEYARVNRLSFNKNKTKVIRFRPQSFRDDSVFSILVGDAEVSESNHVTYLGMLFQSNLQWNNHIATLKNKIAAAIGILFKFKNVFDVKTKLLLYNAIIQSHMNYMPMIYAFKKTTDLKALQRLQNKAIKLVYNILRMHSSISLYRDVSKTILPIFGLYKMQLLLYMYKAVRNIGYHTIEFTMNQNYYSTRNMTNLMVKRCRLETTKQRVEYAGCHEFNHLPNDIKSISRISTFKLNLKKYLLQEIDVLLM